MSASLSVQRCRNRRYHAVALLAALFGCKGDPTVQQFDERADFSKYETFVEKIADASSVELYEGLPNDFGETSLYEYELKTKKTFEWNGYPFYKGALAMEPDDAAKISRFFTEGAVAEPYTSAKECGGFHPDYALEWTLGDQKFRALVCFSCHEILATGPDLEVLTDISSFRYEELRSLLSKYQRSRPQSKVDGVTQLRESFLSTSGGSVHLGVPSGVKPVPGTVTKLGKDEYMATGVELAGPDREAISEILLSAGAIREHVPKKCIFHADYALTWGGNQYEAALLVCLGCNELKYYSSEEPYWFDISDDAADSISKVLSKYRR